MQPVRVLAAIGPVARVLLIGTLIASTTLGGMAAALLAASAQVQRTAFGTLETSVRPDLDGHVVVYVPLVDWRVELLEHDAPATVRIELRGIDRERAGEGLSSADAATRSLDELRRESEVVIERAVRRAVVVASIGGMLGALCAGGLIAALLLRRRWLLVAPLFGAAAVAMVLVPSIRAMQEVGSRRIDVVAAGGHARELPIVLRFAQQLLDVGDEYEEHYATALRSISNLARFSNQGGPADETAIVISDLHANVFVLDALERFAGDSTVFAAGDFVTVGARVEELTAARVADIGGRLVAVSGNHDNPRYMRSLARHGALVLDADQPTATVDGLLVAGYPDPLERDDDSRGEHRLRVYGDAYERQQEAFVAWWDQLDERPDVVLVHQHGFAHRLLEHLAEERDQRPLVVLTGHDHEPHVHDAGAHAIIDAGTVGAGGIVAIGEQDASFARLELRGGQLSAVDLISVEPLTGRATSSRTVLRGSSRG